MKADHRHKRLMQMLESLAVRAFENRFEILMLPKETGLYVYLFVKEDNETHIVRTLVTFDTTEREAVDLQCQMTRCLGKSLFKQAQRILGVMPTREEFEGDCLGR